MLSLKVPQVFLFPIATLQDSSSPLKGKTSSFKLKIISKLSPNFIFDQTYPSKYYLIIQYSTITIIFLIEYC